MMPEEDDETLYVSRIRIYTDLATNLKIYGSIHYFQRMISEILKLIPKSKARYLETIMDSIILGADSNFGAGKNASKSIKLRKDGNKLYEKSKTLNEYIEVLRVYNESIACAPNNSEELALAYGNRAMVLFRLKYFKESLADINRALSQPYPGKTMGKLLFKKVRCMKIFDHPDLMIIYNDALRWIDQYATNVQEKKKELEQALEEAAPTCRTMIDTQFQDDLLEQLKKSCPTSEKVQVGRNSKGELALIAAKDIQLGEVIAVEKIYMQILLMEKTYLACWQCVMMCLNPIPCVNCSVATYCSESCRTEAWNKHHEEECQIMQLVQGLLPEFLLPIMISMDAVKQFGGILPLIKEVYKLSKTEDMKNEHTVVDGSYPSESYRSVYYMVNNFPIPPVKSLENVFRVCMFVYYLATRVTSFIKRQYKGELHTVMKERIPKFLAALIMRHFVMLQQLQKDTILLPTEMIIERSAVTPLFHILNHSCNPNSIKVTLKDHQVLMAVDVIKKGQEITMTYYYTPQIGETIAERRKLVSDRFEDPCKCAMCEDKNPSEFVPLESLKINRDTIRELFMIHMSTSKIIYTHLSCKPKTASEFLHQNTELCENLRPFFAMAPPLCKEVIFYKNYLMAMYLELQNGVYSFLDESQPKS